MFKLMIVDDELIVQEGIKITIEDNFRNVEIVGMASTGREAIEMSQNVMPDIILMDIKMPGINGIEAIERIKKRHANTKFIIISAYEQFEYAKKAVELSVSDYILKPINRDKLIQVLNKVMNEITYEKNQRNTEILNREKLERVMPVLEKGFIYTLLMNADYQKELSKYKDLFEIQRDQAYVMVLEFTIENESNGSALNMEIKADEFYPLVQNAIKYKCKCIIGPLIINRITMIVHEDSFEHEYEQRVKAISLAENIFSSVESLIKGKVQIGIGSCYPLEKIKNSLEEANHALSKMDIESVLHINDISESDVFNSDYSYVDIKADEVRIIQLMEAGNKDALVDELNSFFRKLDRKFTDTDVDTKNIITELMVMVLSSSYKNSLNEAEVGYSTYLSEIKRLDQLIQLENWCINKVIYISQKIQNKKNMHVSNVIVKAKKYIDENYHKDIGLNDVSKEVSISPQYFSTIFKEEIGINFVEYLRNKRIEIAKELLREKQFSVKEICYKIGYNDPNYFSRLFKKLIGVSPTEFK